MVVTRSSTKQTRIDSFSLAESKNEAKTDHRKGIAKFKSQSPIPKPKAENGNSKRKVTASVATSSKASDPPTKRVKSAATKNAKQQHLSPSNDDATDLKSPTVISINRSPVLQLWGACVSEFLHPELSWEACLSIGSTISTLCAVSKGRAIGAIEPKNDGTDDDEAAKKGREREKAKQDTRQYEVMGFPIFLKDDKALVSGKPKPPNEANLVAKFGGDEQYQSVKNGMTEALKSWKDDSESLEKKASHMYEKFRPSVASGQRGWGRKGELSVEEMQGVIRQH